VFEYYFDTFTTASSKLDTILWMIKDMAGGVFLTILFLLIIRIVMRAVLGSMFGKTIARVGGGIFEIALVMILVLQANSNPASVFVALGWSAAIFRKITIGV